MTGSLLARSGALKKTLLKSCIAVMVTGAGSLLQGALIDSFNAPAGGQAVCAASGVVCGATPTVSFANVGGVIGGQRDMRVIRNTGGGRVDGNANAFDLGELAFGAVSASGTIFLQYDGTDNDGTNLNFLLGGGAGVNLLSSVGIQYLISSVVDTGGTMTVRLYTDATNFIEGVDVIPALTGVGLRQLSFNGFTETGNFDLAQVRAITVTIVGNTNLDLTIDYIETYTPEPLTFMLTGAGLVLFGLSRRRKQA
ncbi:MAG: PEP-CTERM sorting domain-containing protein [Bryobacterales bacterium]|nr:PEP-CTERM sorting domain-containing protein [Bryobacterales bacterium]